MQHTIFCYLQSPVVVFKLIHSQWNKITRAQYNIYKFESIVIHFEMKYVVYWNTQSKYLYEYWTTLISWSWPWPNVLNEMSDCIDKKKLLSTRRIWTLNILEFRGCYYCYCWYDPIFHGEGESKVRVFNFS